MEPVKLFILALLLAAQPVTAVVIEPPRDRLVDRAPASKEALELADRVARADYMHFRKGTLEEAEIELYGILINFRFPSPETPCNPLTQACQARAKAHARSQAPAYFEGRKRLTKEVFAAQFELKMSPEEMREAINFMDTSAGIVFARAVKDLIDTPNNGSWRYILQTAHDRLKIDHQKIAEDFFNTTRDLRRGNWDRAPLPDSSPP